MVLFHHRMRLSTFQIILLAFAATILAGACLLTLPIASGEGYSPSFSDALFTSVSATCVTGLVVRDTALGWSLFGKIVILALIQVGGMGVITIALLIVILSGRKISLFQRNIMKEAISADKIGGILRLTSMILQVTVGTEVLGAAILFLSFIKRYDLGKAAWLSLFHSVSAFCNAGFDLMGDQAPFSSLTGYAADPLVNVIIMALIIMGGIGFRTWDDIRTRQRHIRRYRLQTKVILITTLVLILLPAVYFFLAEFQDLTLGRRLLASFFQAVTPRTAGFNTVDEAGLSQTGQMVTILLMLIGGAPGSTAGGMKVTTLAILLSASYSVFSHREDTNLFGRRVDNEMVRQASALFLMYVLLFLAAAMVISKQEGLPLLPCMFETASAIGTVGLSLGLTPGLTQLSRILLMFLMFFGRVGGLTIIFATFTGRNSGMRMPREDISVG